jgi:hypothetical protein
MTSRQGPLGCEGRHARNDVGLVTTGSNHPAQLLLDPASQRDQGQHGQGGVEPAQLSPASPFRDLLACTAMVGRQLGRLGPGMRLPLDHHAGQGAGDAVQHMNVEDDQPA